MAMLGLTRETYRKLFFDVYHKMHSKEILSPLETQIAHVLLQHPYYHVLFHNDKSLERDFLARKGEENPFLHMSLHLVLQDQVKTDRPEGIRKIYQELLHCGMNEHDLEHQMIAILADVLWSSLQFPYANKETEYLQRLAQLLIRH